LLEDVGRGAAAATVGVAEVDVDVGGDAWPTA